MPKPSAPSSTVQPSLSAATPADIQKTLKKVFGHTQLRPGQLDVVQRVLHGTSTLAVMPTGAGKSLCYQLPALLLPGTTVVVSPLVALMKDQCDALAALGVAAVQVNSAIGSEELAAAREAIQCGSARIVLTTPEQIKDVELIQALARHTVSLLVVDEAHCVAQWGHDFRPAFLEIAPAVRALGRPPVLALTATAKPAVMKEIVQQFGIAARDVIQTAAYRPNLQLAVEQLGRPTDRMPRALEIVAASAGTGIVYTATIKAAQELHDKLAGAGESVGLYHGRLPAAERAQVQDAFMDGRVRVMVATNAFGLGIDKPDIRFVLHYQMPSSVDSYYQEAGRAGRDGKDSRCTLLYVRQDRALQQFFNAGRYPTLDDMQAVHGLLLKAAPEGATGWTAEVMVQTASRPKAKMLVALSLLRSHKAVKRDRAGRFSLARELDASAMENLLAGYRSRRDQDEGTLEAMVSYGQSGRCRWNAVLSSLGEAPAFDTCGRCDNCLRLAALAQLAPAVAMPDRPIEVRPEANSKPRFTHGQVVRARRYGTGQVLDANAHSVTVEFPNGATRTFLPEFVRAARKQLRAAAAPPSERGSRTLSDCGA